MITVDVDRHCAEARAAGRRYVLVCFDMWDRMRGDRDLGYYYPAFDHGWEAEAYIAKLALREADDDDTRDRCEAVIELGAGRRVIHDPADWLARRRRH